MAPNNTVRKPISLWNRFFIILSISALFSNYCLQCYNAVRSLYIVSLGGATTFISLLALIGLFCTTMMRIVSGRLSDTANTRLICIIGTIIYMIAMLGFAFSKNLNTLIIFAMCQSIGYSSSATALSVLVANVVPRSRLSEGIGYFGLTSSLASAIGPGIALSLRDAAGYQVVFISVAVFLALSIVFIILCRYEKHPMILEMHEQDNAAMKAEAEAGERKEYVPPKGILKYIEPSAIPCTILSALYTLPMGFVIMFLTLYAEQQGVANVALFFTFSAVAMVVARLAFGKIADRYGTLIVVAPGIALYIAAFVLILIAPGAPGFVICIAGLLYGLSGGMTTPVLNAVVLKQVPVERRGAASGTYMISFDVGIAGGGALWGLTIEKLGYAPTLTICIALACIALVYSFFILRKRKMQPAPQTH